jgi:RNA polymerase sigma factor (sigma-70 family)
MTTAGGRQAGRDAGWRACRHQGGLAVRFWLSGVLSAAGPAGSRWEARVGDEKISSTDAEELAACFKVHAGDLFGYACFVTRGDRARAEDLVQAGFVAAARAWPTVRCLTENQRRSWLRTTVANEAVSGFRRDAALRLRLPRIEARYRRPVADTPAQALSAIVLQRCWQIIGDLPERQHAVAVLRWQQDLKEIEIAAVLGIDERTVSTHLRRARLTLIARLGPDYPFADGDPEGTS